MAETEPAPAKVNLTLHVTGQRADGYHLLDSLVCFAEVGDRISAEADSGLSLALTGPEAGALTAGADNLVLRAARAFGPDTPGARLVLDKHLPTASGIGGGSADAAATLRLLARLWRRALPAPETVLALGADVPVCLAGRTARMTGIGGHLASAPVLPPVWAVLANPRVEVPTPSVFRALKRRDGRSMPADLPRLRSAAELAIWLRMMRNDLEAPAVAVAPVVAEVIATLTALPGCLMARMSGSGATCFGLFPDPLAAAAAAASLRRQRAGWWVADTRLAGDG